MGIMIERKKKLLMIPNSLIPPIYRQVEYLENFDGSYINTGIIPTSQMRVIVEGRTGANVGVAGFIFGSRKDNGSSLSSEMWWGLTWQNYYCYGLGTGRNTKVTTANTIENFVFDFNCTNAHVVKINDNNSVNNGVCESYTFPMYIFGINTGGVLDGQRVNSIRIYKFKVYDSYTTNNKLADFIPCIRVSDEEPGMYDTVTKTFFTNAGTGEFIIPQ